jgi:hypothetical protein
MNAAMLDSLLCNQEKAIERQKQISREKVAKGKEPTEVFTLKRENVLLREPCSYAKDWFFCVPPYFNDALDIRLMERQEVKNKQIIRRYMAWSQGSLFTFSEGNIIYDVPFGVSEPWSETMKKINVALQVRKASPAALVGEGDNVHRFGGNVQCSVSTPDENRERLIERGQVSMTQDELVRVLIEGPNKEIMVFMNTPKFDENGQGLLF